MKTKFAGLKLGSIQTLSKEAMKQVKGGDFNRNPCCPQSPYYSPGNCAAYTAGCQACYKGC